ncbi:hypothetical protein [Nocardia cyriacigeorgica]|uniref:hypothetical protein n=1 Tax=Nocardia cyriacigeorgica TaxID=135487 RepID=UPI00245572E4|nr:hypothetical protein [Nocardia cyriacigeorgica]
MRRLRRRVFAAPGCLASPLPLLAFGVKVNDVVLTIVGGGVGAKHDSPRAGPGP